MPQKKTNTSVLNYYKTLLLYTKATKKNAAIVLQHTDSLIKYQLIVNDYFDSKKKIQIEANLAYNKQKTETLQTQEKYAAAQLKIIGLLILFSLFVVIRVLYTKRKNLRFKLKKEILRNSTERAAEQLAIAKTELTNFTKSIQEKNNLIEQFKIEIEELHTLTNKKETEKAEAIDKLKQAVILTNEDWDNYKKMFDKVYPNYSNNLKEKHPTLPKQN